MAFYLGGARGGEQRGERSRRERSLIVRFNIVRNVNIVSTSSREDEKGRYKRKGGGGEGQEGRRREGRALNSNNPYIRICI